jgi:hypothetical protein
MLAPNPQALTEAAPKWHDVTVVCKTKYECAHVCGVPPEEFGISSSARNIKDAGYAYHEMVDKSESDLIEQGYDEDCIKALPSYSGDSTGVEQQSRDTVDERQSSLGDDGFNPANRKIKITEHYVKMDYEGDGKARLYRVTTGGDDGVILTRSGEDDVVEVDHICFAAMTPVIVTHRFFGRSIADLVMDIQRIKTAVVRGLLDNLYMHNMPRPVVSEQGAGDSTLDDLLVARHGAVIRVKGDAQAAIQWQQVPDITGACYPALQYFDATREWRTGVSRQGQGVDPEALQNQVATIANQMYNASQAKVKLIARIFAETGIRDLFSLLHATIRRHGSQPQTVRLRNKWVEVDPREWKSRDDMTVKVGLGDGSKQEQLAGLQLLIGAQEKAISAGLVSPKNLFNSGKQLCKLLGHKDPEEYFTAPGKPADPQDPASAPIPPPKDPKLIELQAKNEIEKTQAQADIATNRDKMNQEAQMAQMKFQFEAGLEERRFELEKELKLLDAQIKMQQHSEEMNFKREAHSQTMQQKTTDHAMKTEQAKQKAEEGPKAAIQVKHSADELTGPLGEMLSQFSKALAEQSDRQSESMKQQSEAMAAALKQMSAPRRARKNKDGSWQTEMMQ